MLARIEGCSSGTSIGAGRGGSVIAIVIISSIPPLDLALGCCVHLLRERRPAGQEVLFHVLHGGVPLVCLVVMPAAAARVAQDESTQRSRGTASSAASEVPRGRHDNGGPAYE